MNTLAHMAALLAWLWLSIFGFSALNDTPLGLAVLAGGVLVTLVALIDAMMADWGQLITGKSVRGFLPTSWAGLAVVLAVFVFAGFQASAQVGGLSTRDFPSVTALVNSTSPVTADYYDSYESPQGTDYVVPAGQTLYITSLQGHPLAAAATSTTVRIGYGDTAVNATTTAPTAATVVYTITFRTNDDPPAPYAVFIPIPTGKYPFMLVDQDVNIQATGVAR